MSWHAFVNRGVRTRWLDKKSCLQHPASGGSQRKRIWIERKSSDQIYINETERHVIQPFDFLFIRVNTVKIRKDPSDRDGIKTQ